MSTHAKKAILLVSFGTAHAAARLQSLDAIEADIRTAFPNYPVYTAWTSRQLISRCKKEDGILVDTVPESLSRMNSDGVTDVVIQPIFVTPGTENELLQKEASSCANLFASIRIGKPLLSDEAALPAAATAIVSEFSDLPANHTLIFMGHGTATHGTAIYSSLEHTLHQYGFKNIFVRTLKGEPSLETIIPQLDSLKPQKVILVPLMITAGGHAARDLSGNSPDSWKSRLTGAGLSVECVMKGLGEYEAVRRLFVRHTASLI